MIQTVTSRAAALGLFYLASGALISAGHDLLSLLFAAALIPSLVWLSLTDLARYEIPDLCVLWVGFVAVLHVLRSGDGLALHLLTGASVFAVLWAIGELHFRIRGFEGLGIGDAKLFGAGAVLLGPWKLPEFILLSSLGGVIAVAILRFRSRKTEGLPFGPFIAFGMYVLFLLEPLFF